MPTAPLQQALEAGELLTGLFWPAGTDFETPGILSWSDENGALLRLAQLDDGWPIDFNAKFTVHASLHEFPSDELTLQQARVTRKLSPDQPSKIASQTVVIGAHTAPDERWSIAHYRPSDLHEWYPETGMSPPDYSDDSRQLTFTWRQPDPLLVPVPGATITLQPGSVGAHSWSWGPTWQIETTMRFVVRPDAPLTLDDFWRRYRSPLLAFVAFAADRPNDMAEERFVDLDRKCGISVLHEGRHTFNRDWQPNDGHFLFRAADVTSEIDTIASWLAIWRQTEPALGYFGEYIQGGSHYSPQRFLTLYTAAEEYWRRATGEKGRNLRKLRDRAGISNAITNCDNAALKLIGRLRDYYAHLGQPKASPDDTADGTFESTRRLYVLMQACLLRDCGLDTDKIEELIQLHYRSWPVP